MVQVCLVSTMTDVRYVTSGRAYFRGWYNGYPVTSPFEGDAVRMSRAVADRVRDRVNEWFYGYYVV